MNFILGIVYIHIYLNGIKAIFSLAQLNYNWWLFYISFSNRPVAMVEIQKFNQL
jgi:hypothetical protein